MNIRETNSVLDLTADQSFRHRRKSKQLHRALETIISHQGSTEAKLDATTELIATIKKFQTRYPYQISAILDWKGKKNDEAPLLTRAVESNQVEVVQILISAKADLNIKNENSFSALRLCAYHGNYTIAQNLLDAKAEVNVEELKQTLQERAPHLGPISKQPRAISVLLNIGIALETNNVYNQLLIEDQRNPDVRYGIHQLKISLEKQENGVPDDEKSILYQNIRLYCDKLQTLTFFQKRKVVSVLRDSVTMHPGVDLIIADYDDPLERLPFGLEARAVDTILPGSEKIQLKKSK